MSLYYSSLKNKHAFNVLICPCGLVVRKTHNLEIVTVAHKFFLQKFYLLENVNVISVDLLSFEKGNCKLFCICHLSHDVNFIGNISIL